MWQDISNDNEVGHSKQGLDYELSNEEQPNSSKVSLDLNYPHIWPPFLHSGLHFNAFMNCCSYSRGDA